MKFKRALTSIIAGSSLLFAMGTAGATNYEVNIYGASAQFNYWNAMAPSYLRTIKSCSTVQQAQTADKKHAVTKGTSCGTGGADSYIIRVSSKASYDGAYAALQSQDTSTNRVKTCDVSGNVASYGKRPMVDETSCTSWVTVPASGSYTIPQTCSAPSSSTCKQVMIGASDVDASSFNQVSSGALQGPNGGAQTDRAFNGNVDASSLTVKTPIVVPFAFFVNKEVKKSNSTITNISHMQAAMIFSGQATRWTDLGSDFVDQPITACLRHAGSGTHATLDKAVMHDSWGAVLMQSENTNPEDGTIAYFNDGSGDMMNCLNIAANSTNGTGYSIGYADADQSLSSYSNVSRLNYNGANPSALNIIYGAYDNFWSVQRAYYSAGLSSSQKTLVDSMMTFANNPSNLPSSMAQYYAAECELKYTKADDESYPFLRGNTCTIKTSDRTY